LWSVFCTNTWSGVFHCFLCCQQKDQLPSRSVDTFKLHALRPLKIIYSIWKFGCSSDTLALTPRSNQLMAMCIIPSVTTQL
jgi:hypothetical protein